MTNGHPEAVDDAILESGNARAKRGKRNIFWGGTSEEGAVYTMDRSRRKRDANGKVIEGELVKMTVVSPANASVEQLHIENTFLRQLFNMRREVRKSAKVLETERVKSERYGAQCEAVAAALEQLDKVMFECETTVEGGS